MLDKRRLHAHGSPPCTLLLVIAFILTGCFSFWLLSASPSPAVLLAEDVSALSYILLLPENMSGSSSQTYGLQKLTQQAYTLTELPSNDETTLIDINNFRFTINHNPCNKSQPLLLLLIHSAPGNVPKRNIVRETWGRQSANVVVLFIVGWSDQYQSQLLREDRKYMDIIQGNFLDAYRNMTYKHVMALKWATYHCSGAKYILKLDDDVFVHIPAMVDFLKRGLSPWGARRLILCDPISTAMVKRSWRSKWRVSPLEYPGKQYPAYCAGWAILYSPDSVFMLYREAQKEPYFWIDDVHITGTLARKVNLTHSSLHSLVLTGESMHQLLENPDIRREFLFGPPDLTEYNIKALHNLIVSHAT